MAATLIPLFDFIGMIGFLVAFGVGLHQYREAAFEQIFWLAFVFVAALGVLWLGLVTLEWLGIQSTLLDVFSTSLQAVVIGVFAIGSIGTLALVEDLKASHSKTKQERQKAEQARAHAEQRKRELKQTQDLLQKVEQMADVGGWELDCENETLRWTDGAQRIFEFTAETEPDRSELLACVHPDDKETLRVALEECTQEGTPYETELRIITAAGKERWIHTKGEPIQNSTPAPVRAVIQDITARKEREQRLMVLNRVLRHNLRNKVNVIISSAEQLERELAGVEYPEQQIHTEIQETMAAIARSADELDGDLTSVQQFLEEIEAFSTEQAQDNVEEILTTSTDLVSLSDRVRHFHQTCERGTEPIEIGPLLNQITAEYQQKHPHATLTVNGAGQEVRGNPDALRLALGELIENAIIHATASSPTVDIEVGEATEGRVPIRVKDNGPGMPEIERQVLSEGKETPLLHGSGLGLWTVNWVMRRGGGNVEISDNQPQGTVVTLFVPSAT